MTIGNFLKANKTNLSNQLVLTVKSASTHPDFLFFTDCEDTLSMVIHGQLSWDYLSVFLFLLTAHLPWQKKSQEHKGSPHLPIEDYLSHWHGEIARGSIHFVINKICCTLVDLLSYQGGVSNREKFLKRQWQRMKGDLLADVPNYLGKQGNEHSTH